MFFALLLSFMSLTHKHVYKVDTYTYIGIYIIKYTVVIIIFNKLLYVRLSKKNKGLPRGPVVDSMLPGKGHGFNS